MNQNKRSTLRVVVTATIVSVVIFSQEVNADDAYRGATVLAIERNSGGTWKRSQAPARNRGASDSWQQHIMRPILRHGSRSPGDVVPMALENDRQFNQNEPQRSSREYARDGRNDAFRLIQTLLQDLYRMLPDKKN